MALPTQIVDPSEITDKDIRSAMEAAGAAYQTIGDEYYSIMVRDLVYSEGYEEADLEVNPVPIEVKWVLRAKIAMDVCRDKMSTNLTSTLDVQTLAKDEWEKKYLRWKNDHDRYYASLDYESFLSDPKGVSATVTRTMYRQ